MRLPALSAAILLAALGAPALVASPVSAATATSAGTVTVTASGASARALRRAGVTLRAPGASKATTLVDGSTRLTFAASSRTLRGSEATIPVRGELRFVRGTRAVRFTSLRVSVRTGAVRVTGRGPGGRRHTVLTAAPRKGAVTLDAVARFVGVKAAAAALPAATARLLRARLALRATPAGTFGPIAVAAGAQTGSGTSGGATTGTGTATPTVQPPTTEPAAGTRPASAADVVSATIVWRVRESFIRYVNTGEGTSVRDGASADPAENLPEAGVPLVYQFRFPHRGGWSDPAGGAAAVAFSGGVRFRYSAHTIDFTTADPEIELNGAASRAIFRLSGSDGTAFTGKRAVLLNLNPAAAASRTVSPDGKTVTYERIPATIPAGAVDSVFAGFYLAGTPFGWISITYTTA